MEVFSNRGLFNIYGRSHDSTCTSTSWPLHSQEYSVTARLWNHFRVSGYFNHIYATWWCEVLYLTAYQNFHSHHWFFCVLIPAVVFPDFSLIGSLVFGHFCPILDFGSAYSSDLFPCLFLIKSFFCPILRDSSLSVLQCFVTVSKSGTLLWNMSNKILMKNW